METIDINLSDSQLPSLEESSQDRHIWVDSNQVLEISENQISFNTGDQFLPILEIQEEEDSSFVSKDGTITYYLDNGIREVIRPNGIRDIFDMNEYSRTREINGLVTKQFWDGYEWREGQKDPNNPNAVIFSNSQDGKPIRIERYPENDTFKVEFANGLTYDADWKNQKMVRSGGNLPELTLYSTTHINNDGKELWLEGIESVSDDGQLIVEFKPENEEPHEKLRSGEIPTKKTVDLNTGDTHLSYSNGTEKIVSKNGQFVSIKYSNGELIEITKNLHGQITRVEELGGKTWELLVPENDKWLVTDNGTKTDFTGTVKLQNNQQLLFEEPAVGNEIDPQEIDSETESEELIPFPKRAPGLHLTGTQFFENILAVNPQAGKYQNGVIGLNRELEILKQIEAGNIPDFLRNPQKVSVYDTNGNKAELSVMPDYLAIGTNQDWIRVPITPILARVISDRYGLELPTKKLADEIYNQAEHKLTAEGLVSKSSDYKYMQGNGFYLKHNQLIESKLGDTIDGALVAGHKKDLIVSKYAMNNPTKLDYYGFFDANGDPIQNSGGGAHDNTYVDYSHGARFVSENVIVNGKSMRYEDVLRDPNLAGLVSDEGTIDIANIYRQPKHSQYGTLYSH